MSGRTLGVRDIAWWRIAWRPVAGVALLAAARAASPQAGSTAAPPAEAPRIIARLDSGTVAVGDPVTLRILLRLPATGHLVDATPFFSGPLPPGVRLIRTDSVRAAAGGTQTATITVVLFRPGTTQLPPIAAAYRPASGAPPDTARTAPVDVIVTPLVIGGSGTLRDIKTIDMAPISLRTAASIVMGGLAVIVVVLLASRIEQRRHAGAAVARDPAFPGTPAGPYDIALARLAEISQAWTARGDVDAHYASTADVLRRYLADAHGVPAPERTTPELLVALPERLAGQHARAAASQVLDAADLVKFARYAPAPPAPATLVETAHSVLSDWEATR
jgi:hypothetical protein